MVAEMRRVDCLAYLHVSLASFHGCEALGQDDGVPCMCPVPLGISIVSPFPIKKCSSFFSLILHPPQGPSISVLYIPHELLSLPCLVSLLGKVGCFRHR